MTEVDLCRLLTDCLKKDGPTVEMERLAALTPELVKAFLSLARSQRVAPLLCHRLKGKGLDGALHCEAAEQLRDSLRRNTMRNLHLYGELRLLLSELNAKGIPVLLLKGIYLAEAVYENVGLREMSDIDAMAHPADLGPIAGVLTDMGYAPLHPIQKGITHTMRHHLPPIVKEGHAAFEIHWSLTPPNANYSIDPRDVWERALPACIAGCDALVLSPEDLLLHLCWHTSYHHRFAFGLRPSSDIAETISRFGPDLDWNAITGLAIGCGSQRGVYLALQLARELAGADVPSDALERLRPAEMTDTIMAAVRAQIFTDKNLADSVSIFFADFLESRRFWDKIRIFWWRIFLPRAMIAALYSVPMGSLRIYCCYPRRFVDLLCKYGHSRKKYQQSNPYKAIVERTKIIADWLANQTKQGR